MKVGLYTFQVPETVGGGHVLRDDVTRRALSFQGRHQFETISTPHLVLTQSRIQKKMNLLLNRPPQQSDDKAVRLLQDAGQRKIDFLWFNHIDPIYTGIPFILNIFDLQHRLQPIFPEVSDKGQWELRERVWAEATKRAARVTIGSQEAKEQLCHFYGVPLENVSVLPFPTPQRAIDSARAGNGGSNLAEIRAKYEIKNEFLFYPAQFWPHKNHINLLHALRILREQRGRNLSLVLTGSEQGNLGHVQNMAKELQVADQVHFCGFVPSEDILAFYRQAVALSYVSFFGPENLPPLEAMALECPVILSNIEGVRTLHGDAPVYVNPRDPVSIADGVEFVIENPDRMKNRMKEGKEVALRNNCEKYMEGLQQILDELEPLRRCWP